MKNQTSRRQFIKTTAVTAAPLILPHRVWAADTKPSEEIRMGFVGMGKMNISLLKNFLQWDEVRAVAVCDVDTSRRENARKIAEEYYRNNPKRAEGKCDAYNDFRELMTRDDIDVVCIATPDHWHAIITVAALDAGKDVYCEKPLTHNVEEAITVMRAVERNGRVLQTGSMQRSMKEFRVASEVVRNGLIGDLEHIVCSFGKPGFPCDLPTQEVEPGLDWNLWLGPAAERGYHEDLCPRGVHDHYPAWRRYREFGGGKVTDFGAHHIDIAQWGLGVDDSGPVEIHPPKNWEPLKKNIGATLVYANGVTLEHGRSLGIRFTGSDGEIEVGRGKIIFSLGGEKKAQFLSREDKVSLGSQLVKIERDFLGADPKVKLYRSQNHQGDFIQAVQSRKKPITHEGIGARSAISCHLMNASYYYGRMMKWDPQALAFADGTGDEKWLTREYRGEWKIS